MHYNGVSQKQMMKEFKGEVVYNQEVRVLPSQVEKDVSYYLGQIVLTVALHIG